MKIFAGLTVLILFASLLPAQERSDSIIRIGILERVESFNLGCEGGLTLVELKTGRRKELIGRSTHSVKSSASGITVGELKLEDPVRVMSAEAGKFLKANGRRYRDTFLLRKGTQGGLHVINELGLDGYVYGILPREVGSLWPAEALKAQAVVSRTFALKNLHRHDSEGFHLCATVHCQVYGGLDGEKPATNRAVDATHNEIILYHGEPANTFFSSNCGGKTDDPGGAWENSNPLPYLKSVRCGHCKNGGHYQWEKEVSEDDVIGPLLKNRFPVVPPIRSIKVLSRDVSGRAKMIAVRYDGGEFKFRGSKFRSILGANVIRSTLLTKIKKTRDGFLFEGKGWGHGVGMCQEGARGYALKGAKYKKIVRLYFSGTKIKKFED